MRYGYIQMPSYHFPTVWPEASILSPYARERIEMSEPLDKAMRKRAYREYFWFALSLLVVLVASITRQNPINQTPLRTSAVQTLIGASR